MLQPKRLSDGQTNRFPICQTISLDFQNLQINIYNHFILQVSATVKIYSDELGLHRDPCLNDYLQPFPFMTSDISSDHLATYSTKKTNIFTFSSGWKTQFIN